MYRIGKYDPQKIRLIYVTMSSRAEVFIIIKNSNLLPDGVKDTTDKTFMQRQHLDSLIKERNSQNFLHSENELHIKYINNSPALVDKNDKIFSPKN